MQSEMLKLTLHVIAGAGYGRSFDWNSSGEVSPGHTLSFVQSLRSLVDHVMLFFLLPKSFFSLPIKCLKDTRIAYDEVGEYLEELITEEKGVKDVNHSVLTALVKGGVLSQSELVGNAFIILIAGHEST
jgi:cytochrome P450